MMENKIPNSLLKTIKCIYKNTKVMTFGPKRDKVMGDLRI